jgi:hypothetical protein
MSAFHQRLATQWLVVAISSCLAILCFLAALYRKLDLEHIGPSASGRRRLVKSSKQGKLPHEWVQKDRSVLRRYESSEQQQQQRRRRRRIQQQQQQQQQTNDTTTTLICNGHANLCDRRVNETVFAAVHNAMSAFEDGSILLKNHIRSLERALQFGYRGINLDIGTCQGQVSVLHTVCTISTRSLKSVLQSVVSFLQNNPYEVLLLPTQLSTQLLSTKNNITLAAINEVFQSVPEFYDLLYQHPSPSQVWPTLRELITMNRRILFFHYNGESCTPLDTTITTINNTTKTAITDVSNPCPYGFHPWFMHAAETEFSFRTVQDIQEIPKSCRITRGGSSGRNEFFGINLFITPARFVPTWKRINRYSFIQSHIDQCLSYNQKTFVNVIFVNYWGVGDVLDVVYDMNAALSTMPESLYV